jgi:RimJ/RimL family protein N-acetyltransferase
MTAMLRCAASISWNAHVVDLFVPLRDGDLALEPLVETHREALRAACNEDADIWHIYPFSYLGEAFDPQFDLMILRDRPRQCYAIISAGVVVGMTAWIEHGAPGYSIEIGNTYIVPRLRGSGFNDRLKKLMLDHAFACGIERLAFKVDAINTRSQAAVLKLGCIRDTVLFSMLADEWRARSSPIQD